MKKEIERRKGVGYVRVSSDEQVKGTSLDDQETRVIQYAKDNNIELIKIFREEGASAKSADRKVLLESLDFCRKNKVNVFVVWKIDRFARNTEDHFGVRKILLDCGVQLVSVTELIGSDPTGKLMETMLAGFAEFDNAIRRQRCSNGMLARLKSGIWPWKPTVGYICAQNKKHGVKKTEEDKPHPEIFPLMQRCLRAYAKGIFTQKNISDELTRGGFEKLTGIKPTSQFVDQLFGKRLTFFAGYLINPWPEEDGQDKLVKGLHQAMITELEWIEIKQRKFGGKVGVTRSRNNPKFPLRRIVLCDECQTPLTGSTSQGKYRKFDYYHCYNKTCPIRGKSIAKADLESAFLQLLGRVSPTEEFMKYFEEVIINHWQTKAEALIKDSAVYEKQLRNLQKRRTDIFEMRESGEYTSEQFKERIADIDSRIAIEKLSLSETNIDRYDLEAGISYAKQSIMDLVKQWLDLDLPLRVKFQKLIFPSGIRYHRKEGFRTPKLGRIFNLNQQFTSQPSYLVDRSGFEPLTSSLQMRRS
ncbi:MAG: recombinase family protein, partial [Patescibacteria group bacterium]